MTTNNQRVSWKFKGCPRCKGDLHNDSEGNSLIEDAHPFVCIQCGYEEPSGVVLDNRFDQLIGKPVLVKNVNNKINTKEKPMLREDD